MTTITYNGSNVTSGILTSDELREALALSERRGTEKAADELFLPEPLLRLYCHEAGIRLIEGLPVKESIKEE